MELCDFNLHTYIYQEWSSKEELAAQVPFLSRVDSFGPLAKISQIWNIMVDLANGVAFVHTSGYVHRDVKPKNGMRVRRHQLTASSVVFYSRQRMEGC